MPRRPSGSDSAMPERWQMTCRNGSKPSSARPRPDPDDPDAHQENPMTITSSAPAGTDAPSRRGAPRPTRQRMTQHRRKEALLFYLFISPWRSEEHTSELQSRGHLVCRLLLEKKNRKQQT